MGQATGWQGRLELEFLQQAGGTQLARSFVQAPLKVQRPFYPEGEGVCHAVMLHTAGGVVGGDRLETHLHLYPGAQALLTTAAAGKIYRSNQLAQQTTHLKLEAGACLEWLPQETIVFCNARYQQQLRVDLAPEALWLGWEITRLGRTARSERFTEGEWRSQTEVWQGDRLLWVDPQWVAGGDAMLESPHGLAGCPVVGSFAVVGRSLSAEQVEQARQLGGWLADEPLPCSFGVTRLLSGLVCRYRGHSTQAARRWFVAVWQQLRPDLLGRSACIPRVW